MKAVKGILFTCDAAVKQILLTMNEKWSFIVEDLDDHHLVIKADDEYRVRKELEIEYRQHIMQCTFSSMYAAATVLLQIYARCPGLPSSIGASIRRKLPVGFIHPVILEAGERPLSSATSSSTHSPIARVMAFYPEPISHVQVKAILNKHLIARFPNLSLYHVNTMENNSYSYIATSTTYLLDYSLSPHANGATHSSFLIISRPSSDASNDKVYHSNSLAVVRQLIDKIRAGTEVPLHESMLDMTQDIVPYDFLLTPPTPLISSQMMSLSKARKLNLLSTKDLMLIELQLGKFLGQLHAGVQNDWYGLPTLNNKEPAEPSYSWQETFTLLLEHLLNEVSTMEVYADLDLKSKLEDIRKYLSRAIGSFLFEDVEVPSLIWFTGSEDDIIMALPTRPHTTMPSIFSGAPPPPISGPSSNGPHYPTPRYPASYRPSSPPAVFHALNANPPPPPPSLQNLSITLSLGRSPPSSPPPSYASSLTSQHISTLTAMSPSPTLATSTTITTHTSDSGDANYAHSHHFHSTSKSIVTSPMIAAILPNVFHAIWGDPLLESFFLPQPTNTSVSPANSEPSSMTNTPPLTTATPSPSSAYGSSFMPPAITAPPPPSALTSHPALAAHAYSYSYPSHPYSYYPVHLRGHTLSPTSPPAHAHSTTPHPHQDQRQSQEDENEVVESPSTGSKGNPSQALMEGYLGGGGGPILVFPRQRTKRIWYTLFLALLVLTERVPGIPPGFGGVPGAGGAEGAPGVAGSSRTGSGLGSAASTPSSITGPAPASALRTTSTGVGSGGGGVGSDKRWITMREIGSSDQRRWAKEAIKKCIEELKDAPCY